MRCVGRVLLDPPGHSTRRYSESATMGSIRVARRAGSAQATTATRARTAVTTARTSESEALTPNS